MEKVRVRFAPSPTGPLHIGGARSALFNYLFARRFGGQFIVRVEDTDLERSSRASEADILDALEWLGITWDEGVRVGGPHAPYRQTERLAGYQQAAAELVAKGRAYRCYCSEAELEKEREDCLAQGLDPRYGGRCRELTPAAEAAFQAAGRQPVIRFKVPDAGNVVVDDLVRGEVTFDCAGIGDFVIVKSDGIPTYNFAVVMDDVSMGITHVIRGEEHLSNTPRQLLIYEALNLPKPRFAHVSLILGKDRSKMSKRHGATAVGQYRAQGYLPEALVNFLALLGWSPGEEEEVFSLAQLSERFSLDRVAKNPAVFDLDKLNWLNGVYIRQAAPERIAELATPFLVQAGYLQEPLEAGARAKVALIAAAVQEKIEYVAQVTEYAPLFFGEKVAFASEAEKAVLAGEQVPAVLAAFVRQVARAEELSPAGVKSLLKAVTKETKQKGGRVFMPIRVALTGQQHGPDLQYLIPALGRELVFARVKNTAAQAGIEL